MGDNESVMKVKKDQGAVELYSLGTNPACEVMEVSATREHSAETGSMNRAFKDEPNSFFSLEFFLVTFILLLS